MIELVALAIAYFIVAAMIIGWGHDERLDEEETET